MKSVGIRISLRELAMKLSLPNMPQFVGQDINCRLLARGKVGVRKIVPPGRRKMIRLLGRDVNKRALEVVPRNAKKTASAA
jgi:hypothetical protein